MKESFILYNSFYDPIKGLSSEEKGILLDAIFRYHIEGNVTEMPSVLAMAFAFMRDHFDRNMVKYEATVEKNSRNGKLGGRPAISPQKTTGLFTNPPESKKADNVNDIVNDDVNDNENEKEEYDDFLTKIIGAFQSSYLDVYNSEYILMSKGKERAAASKILQLYKKKFPGSKSEETIESITAYFKNCCMIQDDWLQKNMSLPIIVSKFNEINKKLNNGTHKKPVTANISDLTNLAESIGARYGQ